MSSELDQEDYVLVDDNADKGKQSGASPFFLTAPASNEAGNTTGRTDEQGMPSYSVVYATSG